MNKFFDKLESPVELSKHDSIKELSKYDKCYCGSNKDYKQCHMDINRKEKKVAIMISNSKSKSINFKLISIEDYDIFKGVSKNKIGVENTFSSTEISNAERVKN